MSLYCMKNRGLCNWSIMAKCLVMTSTNRLSIYSVYSFFK